MNNFNFSNGNFNPISEYPYGELPKKYTKQGQQQLKEELKTRNFVTMANTQSEQNFENNNSNTQNFGSDFSQLLPLLLGQSGNNAGLDTINKLMPLLSGNGKLDMQTLLKLFSEFNKHSSSVTTTKKSDINIDDLKKVE